MNEALAYIDKTLDNVADLQPDTTWQNAEVVSMLEEVRSLMLTGKTTPGAFEEAHTPTDDEREDMIAFLLRDHNFEESPWGRTYTDAEIANALRRSEARHD